MEDFTKVHTNHSQKHSDLAGEHFITDIGQLILFIIFVATIMIDIFLLKFSIKIIGSLPLLISIPLFLLFFITGSYLIMKSHKIIFGKEKKTARFVTEGVFNIVRHPMYLGSVLLFLSFVFLSYSILSFFVWLIICSFYYFVSKHEEKLLISKFGDSYKKYREKVPMFLPFLK